MAGTRKLTDAQLDLIIEGHSLGLSNREIAEFAGVHHKTVGQWLRKMDLPSKVERGLPPVPVDDTHSLCRKCGGVVANEDFPFIQGRADGRRLSYCRKCRYQQYRDAVGRSPETYFRYKEQSIRKNKRGHEVDLRDGYLAGLWYAQSGLCFYTDRPMIMSLSQGKSPNGVSVDRVNSAIGYVESNVVLCLDRINSIKRDVTINEMSEWMPGWHWRVSQNLASLQSSVTLAPVVAPGRILVET